MRQLTPWKNKSDARSYEREVIHANPLKTGRIWKKRGVLVIVDRDDVPYNSRLQFMKPQSRLWRVTEMWCGGGEILADKVR